MIVEISGDLFDQNVQAIAHGVNCIGVMGAGIAIQFRKLSEDMYQQYRLKCERRELFPGEFFRYDIDGGFGWGAPLTVYNLATQQRPGANAKYEYIEQSIDKMFKNADYHNIKSIGLPQIGCGIGGLWWPNVRKTIENLYDPNYGFDLLLVTKD